MLIEEQLMALHGFVLAGGPFPQTLLKCDTQLLLLVVLLAGGVTYSQYYYVLAHVVKSVALSLSTRPRSPHPAFNRPPRPGSCTVQFSCSLVLHTHPPHRSKLRPRPTLPQSRLRSFGRRNIPMTHSTAFSGLVLITVPAAALPASTRASRQD